MRIGSVDLTRDVLVIAEIGNNHEGDVGLAEELVHLAAEAGAQAVKFQSIIPRALVAPDQPERLAQLGRFALSEEAHHRLAEAARRAGVMFLSTPFSLGMVDFLAGIAPALKIASGDNDFVPLIERAAETGLPLILSTGMADLAAIARAKALIEAVWARKACDPGLVLLHCVSAYPTPVAEANLGAIRALAALGCPVGYSDHTLGIAAAVLSVGLGARVIEKHFTRSKNQSAFRDHQLSAEPAELREMVLRVREANALIGDGAKRVMPSEGGVAARRSIALARDLPAGHVLAFEDLAWLRPGGGLPPGAEAMVLGRRLRQSLAAGARLSPADLEA